jgi:NAD(P)-dependent dehydrogenase (short-subunit alcohol dehydrogenase family)
LEINLAGRNALITGASRGLGAVIASTYWKCGANLILVARSESDLCCLKNTLMADALPGQSIFFFPVDFHEHAQVQQIIVEVFKAWDRVDILVNNAAIQGPIGASWEHSSRQWADIFQVNFFAPVTIANSVIPGMKKSKAGKIINISGGGATNTRPNFSPYACAKAALVKFSETLASETFPFNIQVNAVAPGTMNTKMIRTIIDAGPEKAGAREYERALDIAGKEESSLEMAAELCVYLASEESKDITGKLISAVWDPWESLHEHAGDLKDSDIYTLRRIMPKDRGKEWGEK